MQSMCKLLYAVFDLSTLTTKIALREYFTLGGCAGPGRPIHTYEQREQATITAFDTHDKNSFERIFHFGRVCWSWQANTHIQAERASHNNIFRHSRHETNANYV